MRKKISFNVLNVCLLKTHFKCSQNTNPSLTFFISVFHSVLTLICVRNELDVFALVTCTHTRIHIYTFVLFRCVLILCLSCPVACLSICVLTKRFAVQSDIFSVRLH